jgi:hypothetical protein
MKQWIVYLTPDKKTQAVECDHTWQQEEDLIRERNVIVGWVSFKHKQDAIDYANQVLI